MSLFSLGVQLEKNCFKINSECQCGGNMVTAY